MNSALYSRGSEHSHDPKWEAVSVVNSLMSKSQMGAENLKHSVEAYYGLTTATTVPEPSKVNTTPTTSYVSTIDTTPKTSDYAQGLYNQSSTPQTNNIVNTVVAADGPVLSGGAESLSAVDEARQAISRAFNRPDGSA